LWVSIHAGLVVAMILSLVALLGLYVRRADRLGAVGFALAVVGMVVAACAFSWEAFLLPPIAREAPELFDWGAPIVADRGVLAGALAGLWLLGLALLGFAPWRARVVLRAKPPRQSRPTVPTGHG